MCVCVCVCVKPVGSVFTVIITLISHHFHIGAVAPFHRPTEPHDWKLMSPRGSVKTHISYWYAYSRFIPYQTHTHTQLSFNVCYTAEAFH